MTGRQFREPDSSESWLEVQRYELLITASGLASHGDRGEPASEVLAYGHSFIKVYRPAPLDLAKRTGQLFPHFGPRRSVEALPSPSSLLPAQIQRPAPPSVLALEDGSLMPSTPALAHITPRF